MQEGQIVGVIKFNKMRTKTCTSSCTKQLHKAVAQAAQEVSSPPKRNQISEIPGMTPPDLNPQISTPNPQRLNPQKRNENFWGFYKSLHTNTWYRT